MFEAAKYGESNNNLCNVLAYKQVEFVHGVIYDGFLVAVVSSMFFAILW